MKVVFVHGVADTYRIWDRVRSALEGRDTEALALPGFDANLPENFASTKEEYVDWVIRRLEAMEAPVHLVGHDWGGILALRVASLRPDLVRTLATGNGPVSREYDWHALAKVWQTPGEGESLMEQLDAKKMDELLRGLGVDAAAAAETARHVDDRMKASILKLYRSALHVGDEWEPGLTNIASPTLIY